MNLDKFMVKELLRNIESDKKVSESNKKISILTIKYIYIKYRNHDIVDVFDFINFIIASIINKAKYLENDYSVYRYIKHYESIYLETSFSEKIKNSKTLSLYNPVNSDEKELLIDIIPSKYNIEEDVLNRILVKEIYNILETNLSDEEKIIINHRFGLFENKIFTQKEISTLINRSQAHVSRVEKSIIRRLRKTVLKKNLNFVV